MSKHARILTGLLLMTAILLVTGCTALADNPTDPTLAMILEQPWENVNAAGSTITIAYVPYKETLAFDTEYTFTPMVSGGTPPYTYAYYLLYYDSDALNGSTSYDVDLTRAASSDPSFTFYFSIPYESYAIYCMVEDAGGQKRTSMIKIPTPGADAAHPNYQERLRSIVASCPAQDDFGKALWLYDYVMGLGDYDYTYTHHGSSGLLNYHTGVCDSYSKLYRDLMITAGFRAGRATGGNHGWNTIELDGQWYMCDPTWDDATRAFDHIYFCLTDTLMALDHTISKYEQYNVSCVSMDHNYYVYQGRTWDLLSRSGYSKDWEAMSAPSDVIHREMSQAGTGSFNVGLPYYVKAATGTTRYVGPTLQYHVAAAALHNKQISYDGRDYYLDIIYDTANSVFRVSVADITAGGILVLPENVTRLTEYVFSGTAACELVVSGSVTALSSTAFADSALSLITLDGPDAAIPYEMITAEDHIAIRCDRSNPAYDYALENGLAVFSR